ncbi:CehA/McbA family metallohydrolase [candidate division KSB1 bacterium]|nr:CehA/McbA family metallohydrolase [candidate division KSB1 bacterium]
MSHRKTIMRILLFILFFVTILKAKNSNNSSFVGKTDTVFCTHQVVLDEQQKILPWFTPRLKAYDHFLHLRWNFIKNIVPNSPGPAPRSNYPQYYFYCAFVEKNGKLEPDWWMNDIGEKIPNWFENARLYYAYTGDSSVMTIVRDMIDYQLEYGTSASDFAWPNFPYTTTNAGDTLFRGFTNLPKLVLHEIQVDHAAEVGLTYYRMYLFSGAKKYLNAAMDVANVLAAHARKGNAEKSVWPYRVVMKTGEITAEYGANWTGAYLLLDNLVKANLGNVDAYADAKNKAKEFLLKFPMKTGYWTDGHSDTGWNINTYKSNLSASNMTLCLFDFPELDPEWKTNIPKLIKWTEDNFVFRSAPGEPSTMWGANIVGEQDSFLVKMDYQTARYAAECARWYAISGDETYKEKAFRSLNWVTYCNDTTGKAFESPVSKGVNSWWSDSYGECPRMFYHAFAGVPEWAPPRENHILYSEGILKDVVYADNRVEYTTTNDGGVEYLRLAFKPAHVTINGKSAKPGEFLKSDVYTLKDLGHGDYSMIFKRSKAGQVVISGAEIPVNIDGAIRFQKMDGFGVNINSSWWYDGDYRNTDVVKPAIDILVDSLGATIFRVVIEEMDWETVNDDENPENFNWTYYNSVFSTTRFQGVWNILRYLNQKGITDGLKISFMGAPPAWMGSNCSVDRDKEAEFIESIAALLWFARKTAGIQFTLVSPMNETELDGREGPNMKDPKQFVRVLKSLAVKLDAIGLRDIRFVTPDAAGDTLFSQCLDEMIADSYLMGKLAHWGVHQYGNDAANYRNIVNRPENHNRSFWITETAGIGNMLGQLDDNATAFIFWDGFDCVYQHAIRNGYGSEPPNDWVFWIQEEGRPLIAYNAADHSWRPRKQYYEFAQIFQFVKPGAIRISATNENNSLVVYAFQNPNEQLVIVGRNNQKNSVILKGTVHNLTHVKPFEMFYTDSLNNKSRSDDITIEDNVFSATIPAKSVFTLAEKTTRHRPEPSGWYAGDMHIHRDCGGSPEDILPEDKFIEMMKVNDLAVISVLADMGNGEVKPSEIDLKKVNGQDFPLSVPGRTIHYDAEWHWDPFGVTFEHKALGGHIVLLGLTEAHQIWEESPYKILEYGRKQNGIVGFCHTEYLNDTIQNDLNCCIPIDYPVEAALRTIDFISEDVYGSISDNYGHYNADATINAYYKMLNCGIRLGLCAGTDYPCNNREPFGTLLTYVAVEEPFTYRKWVEGIRDGRTVVSRNGHQEFLDLKVDGHYIPGDDIQIEGEKTVAIEVKWTTTKELSGRLELIHNGNKVASTHGIASPGHPVVLSAKQEILQSGWLCARRMNDNGHQTHTAPIYVTVDNKPVRASAEDALYFVAWIDNLLEKTSPGNEWNQYFTHDLDIVQGRYRRAKVIYLNIAKEAAGLSER